MFNQLNQSINEITAPEAATVQPLPTFRLRRPFVALLREGLSQQRRGAKANTVPRSREGQVLSRESNSVRYGVVEGAASAVGVAERRWS